MKRLLVVILMLVFITGCGKKDSSATDASDKTPDNKVSEQVGTDDYSKLTPTITGDSLTPTPTPTKEVSEPVITLPSPGIRSMENLLKTAVMPLGNTLYIWGGAWNEEDTGAGIEAVNFGLGEKWQSFYESQNANYDYNDHRYEIHNGLDCSGYIGWLVYNVIETEAGNEGYVTSSTNQAKFLADKGFGLFYDKDDAKTYMCGDIISMKGHVWLCLGTCGDGSVLLLHSSPPGVKLSGTKLSDGSKSEAILLAETYMSTYCKDWYERYPDCSVGSNYLTGNTLFRWDEGVLSGAEEFRVLTTEEVLDFIFK